ncbi:MAG: alpha/beta fold hydrolase [Chloroflexi bacterium]|nr:alpha/beta fold hydrolase [Chloroflexota bacterium]
MPYVETKGHRFNYVIDDYTDPWKPARVVVLHHSAAGNLNRWRAWVPTLARHFRVVRFDMRGHAGTPPPAGLQFSLEELAADIARILDALGVEKADLVGASGGGIVAAQLRVDLGAWGRLLREKGVREWILADAKRRFSPNADPGLIEWFAEEGAKTSAEVVMALQRCLLAEDLTPLLPMIRVPTLILASRESAMMPLEMQRLMARRMPNATLRTFAGVGQNMKVEIPDRLARETLKFVLAHAGPSGR